ncbi:MAG: HipA domain-containing protein [Proteobacteria bacterium]|nr:HipA domain-containing protein [Pseudomonadota bacterium]
MQWFFDNLLPEGGVRQALARLARLDEHDALGLLTTYGEESAGALTLLPEERPFPSDGSYEALTREELRQWANDRSTVPFLAAGGKAHMSLAGAQHKRPLHWQSGTEPSADTLLRPRGLASSIIVKPDNARVELFPYCPANEHFCMALAARVGLDVPRTWLLHLPEPLYVVQRFDRVLLRDGRVERLHQIDLCQLLNKWAGAKYEADGGIGAVEAFRALEGTRQPAVSRHRFIRWLVFNYLIGNSDAHAKNLAFLVSSDGLTVAPCYDLLSVAVYGAAYDHMAMTIADEVRYGWVERAHWDKLAAALNLRPAFLRRVASGLAQVVPSAAREVLADPAFSSDERRFLQRVIAQIDAHARYLAAAVKR